jgi:hypothetical protein
MERRATAAIQLLMLWLLAPLLMGAAVEGEGELLTTNFWLS